MPLVHCRASSRRPYPRCFSTAEGLADLHRPAEDDQHLVEGFPATAREAALITPGKVGGGCFPRAQPITLIDGDRLVDLPTEDRIGMRKSPVDLCEIDDPYCDDTIPPGLEEPGMLPMEMGANSEPLTPLTNLAVAIGSVKSQK